MNDLENYREYTYLVVFTILELHIHWEGFSLTKDVATELILGSKYIFPDNYYKEQ